MGGWRHDGGVGAWPNSTFHAADGWAHNCVFDIAVTLAAAPGGGAPDATWVTAGDEYGSCHGSPSWCGLPSWIGVSRDGGRTFTDTTWDSTYAVDQVGGREREAALLRFLLWGPFKARTLPKNRFLRSCLQANPYRVAVHPFDGSKAVVAARTGLPLTYTRDYGATWANSTGGAVSCGEQGNFWFGQPLAVEQQADPSAPEATVYFYNGTTTVWVSEDTGASFAPVYEGFPAWNVPFFGISTPPRGSSAAGDVWAFAGWKLYHRRVDAF